MENKPNKPPEPKQPVGVYRPRTHIIRTLLILIIIGLVAVGFWRNWFVFTTHESPESDKVDYSLKVDKAKIKADTKRATELTKEEAEKLSREVKDEAKKLSGPGK
jgi:hypothetical protein